MFESRSFLLAILACTSAKIIHDTLPSRGVRLPLVRRVAGGTAVAGLGDYEDV